jgi:ribose transport system substrate-binding protein
VTRAQQTERRNPVFRHALKSSTAGLAVAAVLVTGCGSSSNNSNNATAASGSGGKVNMAAAKTAVAQYSGKPTPFPVDQPLKQKPAGKTIAYMQCSTPACAFFAQIIAPTQKLLGYRLKVVKAGPSANEVQAAMSSIVSLKPNGALLPASDPNQFLDQAKQLDASKTPVSVNGVVDPQKYGFDNAFINNATDKLAGKLMADWAVASTGGGEVVFYGVQELSFTPIMQQAFDKEMAAVCPSCTVRHVSIPIASIGKDAPSRVVSDLQSHPNTKVIVFGNAETGTGLPAALKAANIRPKIIGFGPPPAILGYIKQGEWDAGVGVDAPTMLWSQVDALARLMSGQPQTSGELKGLPPIQILTRATPFDPNKLWTGYPNFAQRFAKLWGQAS